jgi:hypothetical protein
MRSSIDHRDAVSRALITCLTGTRQNIELVLVDHLSTRPALAPSCPSCAPCLFGHGGWNFTLQYLILQRRLLAVSRSDLCAIRVLRLPVGFAPE